MPEVDSGLYKVISVSGADAVDFLQGQLTQDVTRLPDRGYLLAAWCNPKGRVFVTIRLFRLDDAIGLAVPERFVESVVARLGMYRLRSKVEIAILDDISPSTEPEEEGLTALILSGVPTIDETNSEMFTPHMLNLDKLDAISFSKGCYTGQEIVARTENLGKSKRRMMLYEASGNGIQVGDKLSDGDRNVGEVVNVAGQDLLAVTPIDLHDRVLHADGTTVTPKELPYDL
jgi:folate-binding protein YgfZ